MRFPQLPINNKGSNYLSELCKKLIPNHLAGGGENIDINGLFGEGVDVGRGAVFSRIISTLNISGLNNSNLGLIPRH